jgi:hypothetical protein
MADDASAPFRLTADDLVAAGHLYAWNGLRQPRMVIRLVIVWLVFTVVLGLIANGRDLLDPGKWSSNLGLVLAISTIPLISVALIILVLTPITARRTFRQQRSLHGELRYQWTASALTINTEYASFDMPWGHFLRWSEGDKTFLLFESDRLYRVIPKRVLTQDQQDSLRRHLVKVGI